MIQESGAAAAGTEPAYMVVLPTLSGEAGPSISLPTDTVLFAKPSEDAPELGEYASLGQGAFVYDLGAYYSVRLMDREGFGFVRASDALLTSYDPESPPALEKTEADETKEAPETETDLETPLSETDLETPEMETGEVTPELAKPGSKGPIIVTGPFEVKPPDPYIIEHDLNIYYARISVLTGIFVDLSKMAEKADPEVMPWEVPDRPLIEQSFVVFEATAYPAAILGTALKKTQAALYNSGDFSGNANIWRTLTAGFEEPWDVSFFLGYVMDFQREDEPRYMGRNKGYVGLLARMGANHIKDNILIHDPWQALEFKMKKERVFEQSRFDMTFSAGAKFHGHTEISDSLYFTARRSHVDQKLKGGSFLMTNSAYECRLEFDKDLQPMQYLVYAEKKFHRKTAKGVFSLGMGLIVDMDRKYLGTLDDRDGTTTTFILRPNLTF